MEHIAAVLYWCHRYDAVIHLVTAANGAEHAYTLQQVQQSCATMPEPHTIDAERSALLTRGMALGSLTRKTRTNSRRPHSKTC